VRHNYPSFKRHSLVDMKFIYTKISDNIAEGMLNGCHKYLSFWLNIIPCPVETTGEVYFVLVVCVFAR